MGERRTVGQPLSEILEEVLAVAGEEDVAIGALVDQAEERGFGLFMILLALPTMIPILPPGSAALIGLLNIGLAVQMLAGLRRPWLPAWIRRYRLSPSAMRRLRQGGIHVLRKLESLSRPRLLPLPESLVIRVVAFLLLLLGIVLFSPFPFMNTLPGLAILLLGIGLLNRDGLVLMAGAGLSLGILLFVATGAGALYILATTLKRFLAR
ncbi:MAG: exopolysaccharide biosynthesis protein [Armatimonadota bacterium]|nr:exopolysaccharide biosynthesis protein [Armatimonadota bacterium]MDR5703040.1 exopolysaccharide biosynthesis protein [Armatimonadota bacterium]